MVGVTGRRPRGRRRSSAGPTARLDRLVRFAYLVTGSQHGADDAVQTALTPACARWSRISRTDDPDAYVRRMVVNAHVSAWRRTGRRELRIAEVRDRRRARRSTTRPRRWPATTRCGGCAETLPPQQRAAVVLRFYEDLDYPEIARVLDVAEATVRSHVHRGLSAPAPRLLTEEEHA